MALCSSFANPTYTNACSSGLGDVEQVPNFCNQATDTGKADRNQACQLFGGNNGSTYEWGDAKGTGVGSCKYQNTTTSICTSSGGVSGEGVLCTRKNFLGDPLTCCNKDYDLNQGVNNSNCFSDSNRRLTCDPAYRGPKRSGCQTQYLTYCLAGNKPGSNPADSGTYTSKWLDSNSPCRIALDQNYNSSTGQQYAQNLLGGLFNRYFNIDGFQISTPGGANYNTFQNTLLMLAREYPNAAAPFLRDKLCPAYSREDLSTSLDKTNFCGCYLPLSQYRSDPNNLGLQIQCDPVCNVATNVPLVQNGVVQSCTSSFCIIDNVTVNLINSRAGNINLGQVCSSCPNGACQCSIVDVNISASNSKIGNIDLNQACGTQTCYRSNPDGNGYETISCSATTEEQNQEYESGLANRRNEETAENSNRALRITFIVIGVVIVVLVIVGLIILLKARA